MKDELLDIACSRILDKTQMIIDNRNEGSHSAYLKLRKRFSGLDSFQGSKLDEEEKTAILRKEKGTDSIGALTI